MVSPTAPRWTRPLRGNSTLGPGYGETCPYWATIHTGQDFAAPRGTPIYAVASGTVSFTGYHLAYGRLTKVDHGNGIESWYAHQNTQSVSKGDSVSTSTQIGTVGATGNTTGNHLHLEARKNGRHYDPMTMFTSGGGPPDDEELPDTGAPSILTDLTTWNRVAWFFAGLVLIVGGIILTAKRGFKL